MQEEKEVSFEDMNIPKDILHGVYCYGFNKPSKIQQLAISPIIQKKDLIAQSQSGTGKTGAFTIGALSRIDCSNTFPQAIILCNTRELSDQTFNIIKELGKYLDKLSVCQCVGGIPRNKNIEEAGKSQILIGTPGRLNDLIDSRAFDLNKLELFIIDEADELLTNEFLEQTRNIIKNIPDTVQMCIFSATLPENVLRMTKQFMTNPVELLIEKEKLTLKLITQFYIDVVKEQYKQDTIDDLYNQLSINQCIIYVNSAGRAETLMQYMKEKNHNVEVLHSKLENKKRLEVLKRFRKSEFRVLISTDLTCRGIDIQQVTYVINYDIPNDISSYLHRIGRSGRYSKKGIAINFITKRDFRKMREIEKHYDTEISHMPSIDFVNNYISS